jgi:hypothetical protein
MPEPTQAEILWKALQDCKTLTPSLLSGDAAIERLKEINQLVYGAMDELSYVDLRASGGIMPKPTQEQIEAAAKVLAKIADDETISGRPFQQYLDAGKAALKAAATLTPDKRREE